MLANRGGGHNFGVQWTGGLVEAEYWAIVKGSPNLAEAQRFLAFAADPKVQARLPEAGGLGGLAKGSNDGLPPELLAASPTANAGTLFVDEAFWRDNGEKLAAPVRCLAGALSGWHAMPRRTVSRRRCCRRWRRLAPPRVARRAAGGGAGTAAGARGRRRSAALLVLAALLAAPISACCRTANLCRRRRRRGAALRGAAARAGGCGAFPPATLRIAASLAPPAAVIRLVWLQAGLALAAGGLALGFGRALAGAGLGWPAALLLAAAAWPLLRALAAPEA